MQCTACCKARVHNLESSEPVVSTGASNTPCHQSTRTRTTVVQHGKRFPSVRHASEHTCKLFFVNQYLLLLSSLHKINHWSTLKERPVCQSWACMIAAVLARRPGRTPLESPMKNNVHDVAHQQVWCTTTTKHFSELRNAISHFPPAYMLVCGMMLHFTGSMVLAKFLAHPPWILPLCTNYEVIISMVI